MPLTLSREIRSQLSTSAALIDPEAVIEPNRHPRPDKRILIAAGMIAVALLASGASCGNDEPNEPDKPEPREVAFDCATNSEGTVATIIDAAKKEEVLIGDKNHMTGDWRDQFTITTDGEGGITRTDAAGETYITYDRMQAGEPFQVIEQVNSTKVLRFSTTLVDNSAAPEKKPINVTYYC